MFVCECLLAGALRRVVIDSRSVSGVAALDEQRTRIDLRSGTVLSAVAPYRHIRDELLTSRDRMFLVLD
jgi:hypothetical protein